MAATAAYLGVEGGITHAIISSHFRGNDDVELLGGFASFRDVAIALTTGQARFGVFPIDNVISGTFHNGYDLIAQYSLHPLKEIIWRMDYRLLGIPGASIAGLRRVVAYPFVLEACGRFLATLSAAHAEPAIETGTAARAVAESKDPSVAVIASSQAADRYGLVELASRISDAPHDFTRYLLVEGGPREEWTPPSGRARRTSLTFQLRNEQGALLECLKPMTTAGVNVSKIESRAKLEKPYELSFYMDIDADVAAPEVAPALDAMRAQTLELRVLGSYEYEPIDGTKPAFTSRESDHDTAPPSSIRAPAASKSWPKAARESKPGGTVVRIEGVEIGGDDFVVIAGPCSVESHDQIVTTAKFVREHGAVLLRGGAFKPRTSPYAFQGMGWEGVDMLAEAGRIAGLPVVSEVMSVDQVERMEQSVDMLQIGARNMQNFDLLKAVGRAKKPVLLKRGLSATLDELLAAAEYILASGNPDVVLCERGIRTFETATRNTLDLSAVPVLRERTHLPIIVDPSHGVGVRRWIPPLMLAAKAVGAHGIVVEVHPNPAVAKSDADQALRFQQFVDTMGDLRAMPAYRSRGETGRRRAIDG